MQAGSTVQVRQPSIYVTCFAWQQSSALWEGTQIDSYCGRRLGLWKSNAIASILVGERAPMTITRWANLKTSSKTNHIILSHEARHGATLSHAKLHFPGPWVAGQALMQLIQMPHGRGD